MEGFSTAVLFAEGATSQVFRATHEASGKPVAIKVLKSVDADQVRRFRLEADALRRLDHPGIARLVDAGEWDGRPYLATEFIDGAPFDRALAGRTSEAVVRVFVKAVDALAHAHDRGLLHRDLKPANVLVREVDGEPTPVIVDFGLAAELGEPAATASGALLGTPAYMAPEQARGDRAAIGRHTDVYGLGAVLYAALAGRAPYAGDSSGDLIAAILSGPPPRPGAGVPRRLEAIIDCAMARRPERRYGSARRLAADLGAWLDGQSVRAMRGFRWRLARHALGKHPLAAAVAAFVLVAAVLMAGQQVWLERQSDRRQALAVQFNSRLAESRERMRLAHLSPRHDVTRSRRRLEHEIRELQAAAADEWRDDPAIRLVIGELLLDADRPDDAIEWLRAARARGCDDARCSEVLARAHLRRYEKRLERELAFSAPPETGVEAPELARARQLLPAASGVDAGLRLAALSEPLDDVARRAERVLQAQPWNFDALLALAQSRYRAGLEALRDDDLARAMPLFEAAENDFERAAGIARSLPEAYLGVCRARARRVEIAATGRVPGESGLDDLPEFCTAAREVVPGDAGAYSLPVLIFERLAVQARRAGRAEEAAARMRSAFEVLRAAPEPLRATAALRTARARLLTTSVRVEDLAEQEAIERLREALSEARAASEAEPASTPAWHARAIAVALLSERDVADAAALAREAEETARRVAERWPGQRSVRNLLGSSLTNLAWRQRLQDGSGRAALERALAVLEPLVADAPDYDSARNNLGMAYWELALHEIVDGGDFTAAEQRARQAFERLLARTPDHPSARINLSSLNLTIAEALIERGQSPGDRLDRSVGLLEALRADGDYLPCDLALALSLKLRAGAAPSESPALRQSALSHARAGQGYDCERVLAELDPG